jgi:hypothetical protein
MAGIATTAPRDPAAEQIRAQLRKMAGNGGE